MKMSAGPVSFELPETWNDRTVHTFVAPRVVDPRQSPHLRMRSGFRENISIHYERVPHGTTAEQHLEQLVEELKPKLSGFRLLYREAIYLGTSAGHHVAYQFSLRGQRTEVCQLRVAVPLPDARQMMVFTGTAAAHVFENKRKIFWQILQSMELPTLS